MATQRALEMPAIVSNILHQLSEMKYKVKRQYSPEDPVESVEFRPTLVPSVLVNRLWADEGTCVLWGNYPHIPALASMAPERRQYYANKVRKIFTISPPPGSMSSLEYLADLQWPLLKSLEMEVDFARHGDQIRSMLHPQLEHLEISGYMSEGQEYFKQFLLPTIFGLCENLKSIRFGPGELDVPEDLLHSSFLQMHLEWTPSLTNIEIRSGRFVEKDPLFYYLGQRPGLEGLEMDLEPGLDLVPTMQNATVPLFQNLKRLTLMSYPEVAHALIKHLGAVENLELDICRIPEQPVCDADIAVIDTTLCLFSHCPRLRRLTLGFAGLANNCPSETNRLALNGASLISLSSTCPKLTHLNIFSQPSSIDASGISSNDFDSFCANLSHLERLSLKLHPPTASALSASALKSLSTHCSNLSNLRLKVAFDLSALSIPTTAKPNVLFPFLKELGFARPDVGTDFEDAVVHAWGAVLETQFPQLEVLEAWGDWAGEGNESLIYVEPLDNSLGSVWEFLSGVEQNLWEEEDEEEGWEYEDGRLDDVEEVDEEEWEGKEDYEWEKEEVRYLQLGERKPEEQKHLDLENKC
ncbi:hypothetical protein AOQ84DRAFT_362444 [Glonium stellatum]|uniref:Uncharacterized protein n=1 Tax=Glonium stellatum TaxID=574774 RepID=A0A8E2F4I5_9PEZI|nr:hypothetical protein AOQ84DRAFT_362444 [Glonium stellatum]